jgi:hypothetical protein
MEGVYNNNQGLCHGSVTGFHKHPWEMGLSGNFAKLYELIFLRLFEFEVQNFSNYKSVTGITKFLKI